MITLPAILYWASPNVRHPGWRWVTPGSVLALVVWIVASLGLTLYVATFSSYREMYGSIGAVRVFLVWLWLTNIAILLAAELPVGRPSVLSQASVPSVRRASVGHL